MVTMVKTVLIGVLAVAVVPACASTSPSSDTTIVKAESSESGEEVERDQRALRDSGSRWGCRSEACAQGGGGTDKTSPATP